MILKNVIIPQRSKFTQVCIFRLHQMFMHYLCGMVALMDRRKRQQKTLGLIQVRRISTQQELTRLLERAGVPATQSSVSRDLEELGAVKHRGFYTLPKAPDGA